MRAVLALPHANSDVERGFSAVTVTKTNVRTRLLDKTTLGLLRVMLNSRFFGLSLRDFTPTDEFLAYTTNSLSSKWGTLRAAKKAAAARRQQLQAAADGGGAAAGGGGAAAGGGGAAAGEGGGAAAAGGGAASPAIEVSDPDDDSEEGKEGAGEEGGSGSEDDAEHQALEALDMLAEEQDEQDEEDLGAFFHGGINGGIWGGIGVYSHSIPIPFPPTGIEPE